ncbi:MAG: HAD-IB family phosphatase [Candidatus Latescibacteria bacterium]|nr:HAD-IB family phosphatase [Candidatus Latescibacterota bacterium]
MKKIKRQKKYLFVSDFDETISLDDSGVLISQMISIKPETFFSKVKEIRKRNIVQLGGELAYLLITDPAYKNRVKKDTLIKVGQVMRLRNNVKELFKVLKDGIEDVKFTPYVVSACPKPLIVKSLENILPENQIFGTDFKFTSDGRILDIERTAAGQGKVSIIDLLIEKVHIPREQVIYVGDGSSDLHVMLHVNVYGGFTIAVSPSPYLGHISKRTVLSDNALSVLAPILEFCLKYDQNQIKDFFTEIGHPIYKWNRAKTEWLTIE